MQEAPTSSCTVGGEFFSQQRWSMLGALKGIMHAGCSFSGLVVQVTVVWWRAQKPLQVVTPQSDNLQLLLLNRIVKRIQNPKQHVGNGSLLPVMSWLI